MLRIIKNMLKADIRQPNLLFWDWIFPFILILGFAFFIQEPSIHLLTGLVSFLILQGVMFGVPYRISEYRNNGLVDLFGAMTYRLYFSFLLMRSITIMIQALIFLPLGAAILGVSVNFSFVGFISYTILSLIGIIGLGSIGLLIGLLSKSQQGALGLGQLCYFIFAVISGIFYPLSDSPELLQLIGNFSPLTYLHRSLFLLVNTGTMDWISPLVLISLAIILSLVIKLSLKERLKVVQEEV